MLLQLNKLALKSAISRFRKHFTLKHAIGEVTYELNSKNMPELSKQVLQALTDADRPIDRRRAAEIVAMTMTGQTYNPLSARLKAQPTPALLDIADLVHVRNYLFTQKSKLHFSPFIKRILLDELAALKRDDIQLGNEDTAGNFYAQLQHSLAHYGLSNLTMSGFDEAQSENMGDFENWERTLSFTSNDKHYRFVFENTTHPEYGIDEMSMSVFFNNHLISDFMDDGDADDIVIWVITVFERHFMAPMDGDIIPVSDKVSEEMNAALSVLAQAVSTLKANL